MNQGKYLKGVGALGNGLLSLLLLGLSLGLVGSGGVQGQIVDLLLDFSHGCLMLNWDDEWFVREWPFSQLFICLLSASM